ncbi:MAG: hypothetical protein ACYDHX_13765, partial [Methanothrix sp.]
VYSGYYIWELLDAKVVPTPYAEQVLHSLLSIFLNLPKNPTSLSACPQLVARMGRHDLTLVVGKSLILIKSHLLSSILPGGYSTEQ